MAPVCECQLCRVPRGPDPRFEDEQVELVLPDPEAGWRSEAAMIPMSLAQTRFIRIIK